MKYPGVADLVVEELEVPSHDGVLVPLSLIYKKGLKARWPAPLCLMNGYGAYGIFGHPRLISARPATWPCSTGGVVIAETHPRGGSEKGQAWYRAGYQATKPNTLEGLHRLRRLPG